MGASLRKLYERKGYGHYSRASEFFFGITNTFLALLLIIIGAPIFIIIALIIKLKDGGPVLYKGVRLGYKKKPFVMYKFRTLPVGMDKKVGPKLFSYKDQPVPFWARFMRETRLDELPQLFNILKRDMDFIGPRPVRPEVYEEQCKKIRNYDHRFNVKPGLVGYSQLFTPHSTPKRIRALIDNKLLKLKYSILLQLYLVALAIFMSIKRLIIYSRKFLYDFYNLYLTRRFAHKRSMDRIIAPEVTVKIFGCSSGPNQMASGHVVDANERFVRIASEEEISEKEKYLLKFDIPSRDDKRKTAEAYGELWRIYQPKSDPGWFHYVFKYQPASSLQQYLIDQYLLRKSLFSWLTIRLK